MLTNFEKIKNYADLTNEFIFLNEEAFPAENLKYSHLKHKIINNFYCSSYEIKINEEYFHKMKENEMKHFYPEFNKRVFNNLLLKVYHFFVEERGGEYFLYMIFEKTEFMISQSFSFKKSPKALVKTKSKEEIETNLNLSPKAKMKKANSTILNDKFFNMPGEDLLIQIISFYYDVMSLLAFIANKKYHFSYYFHLVNPFFIFISQLDADEKFVFHIKHKFIMKFILIPEPLMNFFYSNCAFFHTPISYFFEKLNEKNLIFKKDFQSLGQIAPFYNIFMSSKLFLDILQNIRNNDLSKHLYTLKADFMNLLNKGIDFYVIESLLTKESERFSEKHFLNNYYKEIKNFLQVYVFSEKIKEIFHKAKSKIYQYIIIKDVTQNHILQKILENSNPLVKSLHFSDCKIDLEFFKDITVAFQFLEELIIKNVSRNSKLYRLEENQLKSLIYSGKMKNLRILDLTGNSIRLSGPLFINKVESASLREKALPNIIEINLSKNELKCEDCHKILQEPVFGNVRKINLSENSIDSVFNDEKGYSLLSKLESLNVSKNLLTNNGSQKLFASYGFENLKKLDLSHNKIITPVKISHLINLRVLKIDFNQINCAGCQSIFNNEYLIKLEELSLVGNAIKQPLTKETVNNLTNLKKLNLNKNLIVNDKAQILFLKEMRLDKLSELDLSNNEIDSLIPPSDKMNENLRKNLKFLNLSYNSFTDEGANLIFQTDFENLFTLNLNFNEIWEPVNEEYKLLNLIRLELNNNRISDTGCQRLFEKLSPSCKLRKLDLQRNKISIPIDSSNSNIPENMIEKLNLNFNRINCQGSQSLFSCEKFKNLKELMLACNKIVVPIKENKIPSLTNLSLACNLINSTGANAIFTSDLINLVVLDLYKNTIEIPFEGENQLKKLKQLDLTSNKINCKGSKQIFSSKNFAKLEKLDLTSNKIEIPFEENNLINLQHLSIKKNMLTSEGCQAIFQNPNFKNLNKLYLRNNQIEIPVIFSSKCTLSNLYKINLVENKVSSEGCQNLLKINELDHLQIISLSRNKIEYPIDCNSTCHLKNLRRLNLSFNPLKYEGVAPLFYCPGLKNLETLKIMETELVEILDLSKHMELTKLRFLLLAQNKINSIGCQNILCTEMKNLQILDLCNNNIEIPIKEKIPEKPKLATIYLSKNSIGSEGCSLLFSTKAFPKLLNLDLADNNIQKISLQDFNLKSLAQINLVDNNLDYESNLVVDELNKKIKILF